VIPVSVTNFNRMQSNTHSLTSILQKEGYKLFHPWDDSSKVKITFDEVVLVRSMEPEDLRLVAMKGTILSSLKRAWVRESNRIRKRDELPSTW
jgi:hypothetical protein